MERPKHFLILLQILLFSVHWCIASYKTEIYNAYISNKMENWKTSIDKMNLENNKSDDFILELINYQYGYIAFCIGTQKDNEAGKYLDMAVKNIAILDKKGFKPAEISAYKSAFYGYEIGLNNLKAPFIGPKSVKFSKLAMEQDPQNPMGFIQYGNSQFYMPAIFGGSKKEAIEYFLKAEKLMEKDKTKIKNDWNYLSLLVLIGQSYVAIDDYKNAKIYYEKALTFEPGFLYVKLELLPDLLKKMK